MRTTDRWNLRLWLICSLLSFCFPAAAQPPSASVLASRVELEFPFVLSSSRRPQPQDFQLRVDGKRHEVRAVTVRDRRLLLGLSSPVTAGQRVTLGYSPRRPALRNRNGAPVRGWRDLPVHNRSWFHAQAVAVGPDGEVIVAGGFEGAVRLGQRLLVAQGESDLFVARAAGGGWDWAWAAGGPGPDEAGGLALDAEGTVYLTGSAAAGARFGADRIDSAGADALFVAALDPAKGWRWVSSAGGTGGGGDGRNQGRRLVLAPDGGLYVAGSFHGQVRFGGQRLTSAGASDLLLARLDRQGQWLWALSAGGPGADTAYGLALDRQGRPLITGEALKEAGFEHEGGRWSFMGRGWIPVLASATPDGRWRWASRAPGLIGPGQSVTVDGEGGIYVAGTAVVENDEPGALPRAFVGRWDDQGRQLWLTVAAGGDRSAASAVQTVGDQVYVVGQFSVDLALGRQDLRAAAPGPGLFVAALASKDGRGRWLRPGGGRLLMPTDLGRRPGGGLVAAGMPALDQRGSGPEALLWFIPAADTAAATPPAALPPIARAR